MTKRDNIGTFNQGCFCSLNLSSSIPILTSISSRSLDYGSIDQALKESLHIGTKKVDKSSKTSIAMPMTSLTKKVSGSSSEGTDED
jgi:hypothetical protein